MIEMRFFPEHHAAFRRMLEDLRRQTVAVLGHLRPDGDCIGSMVGLIRMLRAERIDAVGVLKDSIPLNLRGFIGDTPIFGLESAPLAGRVAITVDCADDRRMGGSLRDRFAGIAVNIDHHVSNPGYGAVNMVSPEASATAEILAGLALDLGLTLDAVAAQALYAGIATDTGQFRFASTSPRVFEVSCQLCGKGADPARAAFQLYENESFAKLSLLQRFLASLRLEFGGRVCVGELRKADYQETGASPEDSEGLVDYARAIAGVDLGVLVEERDDGMKASLRAKDPVYQVHEIARLFGGGGHACAAGLNVKQPLEKFRPALLAAIADHLPKVANGRGRPG